jgi:hypothetical protein
MSIEFNRAERLDLPFGTNASDFEAILQSEDPSEPPLTGGVPCGPTGPFCERYVSRERLAQIMGVSVKTIDRLVVMGMPSETWGVRVRRFLPSRALAWAHERVALSA